MLRPKFNHFIILILPVQLTCESVESQKRLPIFRDLFQTPSLATGPLSTSVRYKSDPDDATGPYSFFVVVTSVVVWTHRGLTSTVSLFWKTHPSIPFKLSSSKILCLSYNANKNDTKTKNVKHVSRQNSTDFFGAFLDILILQSRKYEFWWNVILSLNESENQQTMLSILVALKSHIHITQQETSRPCNFFRRDLKNAFFWRFI